MPTSAFTAPALLERAPQLATLASLRREAADGAGRVALVCGEAGIGKTSLLTRFAEDVGPDLLWGACDPLLTPRPLGPLHDIAPQLGGPLRALLDGQAARPRVFSAFLDGLGDASRVVVFEDVHWADEATLDLLRWLGRRIARTATLLVATFRDDELGPTHPLRVVLGDLAAAGVARRIELPALTPEAVATLARGHDVNPAALHASTAGNPFFVTEALASGGAGVPAGVRDAVLARAARLTARARAVLDAAAVIGPRIEYDVLAGVASVAVIEAGIENDGLEWKAMVAESEACVAAGMLKSVGEALQFRHELGREAILDAIPVPRRQALHAATLAGLACRPRALEEPARIAYHAEASRDRPAVLMFAPMAARAAEAAGAHRQAYEQWARALRFSDHEPPEERVVLLERFAAECGVVGRPAEGVAPRLEAAELRLAVGEPAKQGENLCWVQGLYVSAGMNAEAEEASVRALEVLEPLPPGSELALAYRFRSFLRMLSRDIEESLTWGERAVAMAERFGPPTTLAMAVNTLGTALCFADYERGCALLERSMAIAIEAGLDTQVAAAWLQLGSASGEVHQFERADGYLARGVEYAAERQLDTSHWYMTAWRALTHLHLGRWPECGATAETITRRPDATPLSRSMALLALGRLRARRGDPGAMEALDEALELSRAMNHLQRLGPVHAARAEAALLAGDPDRARREALAVWDLAMEKRHPWFVGELAWWRRAAGDGFDPPPIAAPPYALQLAGDWRGAAAEWERMACPYERARALAEGDDDARREALAIFDHLGARPAGELLRRRMRAEGARSVPRGPRRTTRENPFGLTAREVEVLAGMAAGASNARIATGLHISVRTVDHHVASILAKLDVPSRDAAVALASENGLLPPP